VTGWPTGVVEAGIALLLCGWLASLLVERLARSGGRGTPIVRLAARRCGIAQGLGAAVAATAFVLWMIIALL
jgi:hypothetical protein